MSRHRGDEGRVTLLMVVFSLAIFAVIGLAADGGAKIRAIQRANNIAAEAARAGGQALDPTLAVAGGDKVVDPDAAVTAAQSYLNAAGVPGTVSVSGDRTQVHVTVTIVVPTAILSLFGVNQMTVTGTGTSQILVG